MKKIHLLLIKLISKIIGKKKLESLLVYTAKTANVNLHVHGLIQNGGLSSFDQKINGEQLFLAKILPSLLKTESALTLFDVGANIGDFSLELIKSFPNADIHSFEPVKATFDILAKNTFGLDIKLHGVGFGETIGNGELFNTVNKTNNTIASAYKDVFHEVFKNDDKLGSIVFEMDTLDNFCKSNNITLVDFLKIDVEGHELSVLKGATQLIRNKKIKIIQFEFNSHNVHSRVFLRDFYAILQDFEFYRIVPGGLIALGAYNHINEIFMLQNIVAVNRRICNLIDVKYLKHPL
jgi:FkbM family methyltransferase